MNKHAGREFNNTHKTPISREEQLLSETYVKLKKTTRLLKKLGLYTTKYLYKRNDIYYLSLKIDDIVVKKSLRTNNLTYANILKIKIFNRMRKMGVDDILNDKFIGEIRGNELVWIAENEEERKLLDEHQRMLENRAKRDAKNNPHINTTGLEIRDRATLKQYLKEYIEFKESLSTTKEKTLNSYKLAANLLNIFFGDKQKIRKLTVKDANDFRNFLIRAPKNFTRNKEFEKYNMKTLVEKKSKILDKFDKPTINTVNEKIKIINTMFNYFENNLYIHKNHFSSLIKIEKDASLKREFKHDELKSVFDYLRQKKLEEEYNYCQFCLYTGLRRGEVFKLTLDDINLDTYIINVDGTKTDYAKRKVVIHQDLLQIINKQIHNKKRYDNLFFNEDQSENRENKIGVRINKRIKLAVGDAVKKFVDIHSIRKNFSQEIFLSDLFKELDYKTLLGHSTLNDITDRYYILGKRDYVQLKKKIDKVSFKHYFSKNVKLKANIKLGL